MKDGWQRAQSLFSSLLPAVIFTVAESASLKLQLFSGCESPAETSHTQRVKKHLEECS